MISDADLQALLHEREAVIDEGGSEPDADDFDDGQGGSTVIDPEDTEAD